MENNNKKVVKHSSVGEGGEGLSNGASTYNLFTFLSASY